MTKPYDRNDNDTYVEILSRTPSQDVEYHMFRDDTGRFVMNDIRGNFTVETGKRAADNVLHFPKATAVGLVNIKSLTLRTPFPMSLVQRYSLKQDSLLYSQKTPLFFDGKEEKFVVLMDYRFLRDIKAEEFMPTLRGEHAKEIKLYKLKDDADSKVIGILFDSVSEAKESIQKEAGAFGALVEHYRNYYFSLQEGQKVILVRHIHGDGRPKFITSKNRDCEEIATSTRLSLELCIAFRFHDRYYLSKDGENFDQKNVMFVNKKGLQGGSSHGALVGGHFVRLEDEKGMLVLPYTDEQFHFLTSMQTRLESLNAEIAGFFNSFVSSGSDLDHQITPERVLELSPGMKLLASSKDC